VCRHAASFSRLCSDAFAVTVYWRDSDFCPLECAENMEYQACGDPCLPTCTDTAGENCGDLGPCTEVCFCVSGYVYDGEKCIDSSNCGCLVPDFGFMVNVGESYEADDCSTRCTCEEAGADLVCEDTSCQGNYVCGALNGNPTCRCLPPFIEQGDECGELTNPCTSSTEGLWCFTCNADYDDDCEQFGAMQFCDYGEDVEAMCFYRQRKDASAAIVNVERGCRKKANCLPDAIGLGILFCDKSGDGTEVCYRCNYGDTDNTAEGAIETAKCDAPPDPDAATDPCVLPKDVGKGKGTDKVFYFDQAKEKCMSFTFKGTGGNSNRFDSKEACEEQCGFQAPDICSLEMDVGTGPKKGSKTRFWYNAKKGKCLKFKYTNEGGNENNFKNKKECAKACSG